MKDEGMKQLVIVTGMSGAGKSVVIQCLEDLGYFCMDNLPPVLLPKFVELMEDNTSLSRVAIGIDLRGKDFFEALATELHDIKDMKNISIRVLYIDASDGVLVSRFKETRRTHPLSVEGELLEAIKKERIALSDIRGISTHMIDTSNLKTKELRGHIIKLFGDGQNEIFQMTVMSFGFKHGVPIDADLMFDVRFLPNPYYVDALRPKTGLDKEVYNYVMQWKDTTLFYEKLMDLLTFVIPGYIREGKSQVVIAIGCTGGQHRSVALTERISHDLKNTFDFEINTHHRDAHIEGHVHETT